MSERLLLLISSRVHLSPRCDPAVLLTQRTRAAAADLERCEQKLGAARYGEWLAVLTAHDSGSIDTSEAVERAKAALSVGANHSLVLQLNSFLPSSLRISPLQLMMKNPNKSAPAAPAAASPPISPAAPAGGDPNDMLAHFTEPGWRAALSREIDKPYFKRIVEHVAKERRSKKIFPPAAEVFSAFNYTPFANVKVVIIGQDPYHGPGQAHGLCFSVAKGVAIPPSLRNSTSSMAASFEPFLCYRHRPGSCTSACHFAVYVCSRSVQGAGD